MSEPPFDPSAVSPSARVLSMVVTNDRRELARIGERVERFASESRLSSDHAASLNLVLDELVSNVIKYGYDDQAPHEIHVTIEIQGDLMTVSVEDDGKPFNPVEAPLPNLDLPIEERPIGGLGVLLIRSLVDVLDYRRERGRNIVTLKKRVNPA
jgi:sigma-B regulation protein RsbU (phosphoserine phosphatase)